MVLKGAVDSLKDRPHDEKKVVATSIAVTLVIILFVGWGFLFLRKIQKGALTPTLQGTAVPLDQFNPALLKQAEQYIPQVSTRNDAKTMQDTAAQSQVQDTSTNAQSVTPDNSTGDQFNQNY